MSEDLSTRVQKLEDGMTQIVDRIETMQAMLTHVLNSNPPGVVEDRASSSAHVTSDVPGGVVVKRASSSSNKDTEQQSDLQSKNHSPSPEVVVERPKPNMQKLEAGIRNMVSQRYQDSRYNKEISRAVLETVIIENPTQFRIQLDDERMWNSILGTQCDRVRDFILFEKQMKSYANSKYLQRLRYTDWTSNYCAVGLQNDSIWCYLNSFLQAVACIPSVANLCSQFELKLQSINVQDMNEARLKLLLVDDFVGSEDEEDETALKTAITKLAYQGEKYSGWFVGAYWGSENVLEDPIKAEEFYLDRVKIELAKNRSNKMSDNMMMQHFALLYLITITSKFSHHGGGRSNRKTIDEQFNDSCLAYFDSFENAHTTFRSYREIIGSFIGVADEHNKYREYPSNLCVQLASSENQQDPIDIFNSIFCNVNLFEPTLNENFDVKGANWDSEGTSSKASFFDMFRSLFLVVRPQQVFKEDGSHYVSNVHFRPNEFPNLYLNDLSPYYLILQNVGEKSGEVQDLKTLIWRDFHLRHQDSFAVDQQEITHAEVFCQHPRSDFFGTATPINTKQQIASGDVFRIPVNAPNILCLRKNIYHNDSKRGKKNDFNVSASWEKFKPFDDERIIAPGVKEAVYCLRSHIHRRDNGSLTHGHYTCYTSCAKTRKFFFIDDSRQNEISSEIFFEKASSAYMYFFEKI